MLMIIYGLGTVRPGQNRHADDSVPACSHILIKDAGF